MIGNIDFQKHQIKSGDIINSVISSFKAHSKKVSADTFVEFVNNELKYTTYSCGRILIDLYMYFYMTSIKLNDNKVLLFHRAGDNNAKLACTVIYLDSNGITLISEEMVIDSTNNSGTNYKAALLSNQNEIYRLAVVYGATGISNLTVKIIEIDTSTSTPVLSVNSSKLLSEANNSSQGLSLTQISNTKLAIFHGSGTQLVGQILNIDGNVVTSSSVTTISTGTDSYYYTKSALIDSNRILVTHCDSQSNSYLDAVVVKIDNQDTMSLGVSNRIENTQYAAQGSNCVYLKDGYALITYDDSDNLSGKLVYINDTTITIIRKVFIAMSAGSYNHVLVKVNANTMFVTYNSDMSANGWDYTILYLVGNRIEQDIVGTFTAGDSSDIPWPIAGASSMAITALNENEVIIFYADANNETSAVKLLFNNVDIIYDNSQVIQGKTPPSGIIKLSDNKVFLVDTITNSTDFNLCCRLLSTENDTLQELASLTFSDNETAFMESDNHRMFLNQIIDNTAEIVLLYNKKVDTNDYDLYYGIVRVNLEENIISFENKTKLSTVNQSTTSHCIFKIDDNSCMVTMTNDATNNYIYGQLYQLVYDANGKLTALSEESNTGVNISSCKDSGWMYNCAKIDDSNFIFFFRDYNDSMKIKATLVNVSNNTINTYAKDTMIVNKSEAAMCVQPMKVDDDKVLLLCCDYDPGQGAWGAWYLGAVLVWYDLVNHSLTSPFSNFPTRICDYSSITDPALLEIGDRDFMFICNDYDNSQDKNVIIAAKRLTVSNRSIIITSNPTIIDSTNTYITEIFYVELEKGKFLITHGDNSSNNNFTGQILYIPNFIGPSVIESNIEIDGLSKTRVSMTKEGEIYTKA